MMRMFAFSPTRFAGAPSRRGPYVPTFADFFKGWNFHTRAFKAPSRREPYVPTSADFFQGMEFSYPRFQGPLREGAPAKRVGENASTQE